MKKNYRLKDLMLGSNEIELLNEVSNQIGLRNSDFARFILKQELQRIKAMGCNNYSLAIIGSNKHKKSVTRT